MRPLILVWILVASFVVLGAAQDLTPSISWKNPNITSSKDDRIKIASAALDKAVSMPQPNGQFDDSLYGTPGRLYGQMAEFDRLTNQTKYKQILKQGFALAEPVNSEFSSTLSSTTTLAGGTYWKTDSDKPKVASLASVFFLTLSALLAEATSHQMYLDAAIDSANVIQSHLLNPSNIVLDPVLSMSNESCSVDSTVYSYNSGIFIEGLVVLADITRNASTEVLLRSTIVAVATDTLWQGLDGIIITTTVGGQYIVRALAALYERNTTSSDLREYIKEYIGVQATSNGSNIYGLPWKAPPSTSFSSDNETAAVSALLSAIQLADDQLSSASSGDPISSATLTPSAAASSTKKSLAGAIVGGVVGGLAVL
ncbi:hypothetical protein ARMSODRAFT_1025983 [Armillaria solidipes]|uniref:Uncharacterized protein n=1 Tax=Armillaria solidipes TaxID=1076256 RepID=A0A2H3AQJ9_9AGAR|nr:hypothetical protein ARMSODRAFT_1025983 [Armillaria solidipes]